MRYNRVDKHRIRHDLDQISCVQLKLRCAVTHVKVIKEFGEPLDEESKCVIVLE